MNTIFKLALLVTFFTVGTASAEMPIPFGQLGIKSALNSLPEESDQLYVERRLLDNGNIGVRVFRVYKPVPPHYHAYSSTYLSIQSGRALFAIEGGEPFKAGPGDMIFWEKGLVHELIRIIEHPFTALAIDTPTRRKDDTQMINN
ncbi:MAG: cupin domain-containing protein [Thiotrichales bacterium]|nr:cupin domain-containing protein [Thiotrichales bacterium]